MNLDARENHMRLVLGLVTFIGLIVAFALGGIIANGDLSKLSIFIALAVGACVCLGLGKKVWYLIPFCWLLVGKIGVLPLPLSVRDLGVLTAFGMFLAFTAFKQAGKLASLNRYDLLLGVNLAYLVSVYVRNPVGTSAFGTEMVGGRPYFDVFVAVLAFWVLQHIEITRREGRLIPLFLAVGSVFVSALGALTQRIPALVPLIAPFYSGVSVSTYLSEQNGSSGGGADEYRFTSLQQFGSTTGSVLASYFRPFSLIVFAKPIWSVLLYAAFAAILLSGFRSGFVGFGFFLALSSYFYSGLKDVIRIGVVILLGVTIIIGLQGSGVSIHPAIQRALSFIPGPWDPDVVRGAESSNEWRFDMWKIALESDKYIHNKLLGDGFGFTAYELQIQLAASWGGQGYINANVTEAQLVTGAYHSGPISAVRYVGLVGLALFTMLLVASAFYAWKLINRARYTPFFPLALFVGIPVIYKPFEYWFIFGGFDSDAPKAVFALAMLNLTNRAVTRYQHENSVASPTTLPQVSQESMSKPASNLPRSVAKPRANFQPKHSPQKN